ncbi:glycosyltransferase family 4 protein, partial [Petrachloros mirabilis]
WALTFAVRGNDSTVLCQNADDRDRLCAEGIVRADQTRIVAGSGVDTERFRAVGQPQGVPIVLLPSRMLWDKGIQEFVDAARLLRSEGMNARFILVGRCDEDNPAAIVPGQIESWVREGIVEWWGHREDMSEVYAQASFVVLPSYREGLPKVLLEAGACGKALIATNVPGCREVVRHRVNGLLVPPRHAAELAEAIKTMLVDAPERERMGKAARELIVREFSVSHITGQMVSLYRELLKFRERDSSFKGQA